MAHPPFGGQGLYVICPKLGPGLMVTQSLTTSTTSYTLSLQEAGDPEPNLNIWVISDNEGDTSRYNIISPRNGGVLNATSVPGGFQLQSSSAIPNDPRKEAGFCWDIVNTGDGDNSYYINGPKGAYQWNISGGKVVGGAQVIAFKQDNVAWAKFYFILSGNNNHGTPPSS